MLTALEVLLSLGRYQFMKDVIQVREEWQGFEAHSLDNDGTQK